MRRIALALLIVPIAIGCRPAPPASEEAALKAKPSPIEVGGFKVSARLKALEGKEVSRFVTVEVEPLGTDADEYELRVFSGRDANHGNGGTSGTGRLSFATLLRESFGPSDPEVFGQITRFATRDEEIQLPSAEIVRGAPNTYFLRLDHEVTNYTSTGTTILFPPQDRYAIKPGELGSAREPVLVVRYELKADTLFENKDPSKPVQVTLHDLQGNFRSRSTEAPKGTNPAFQVVVAYPSRQTGRIAAMRFVARHRTDKEVIPFAIVPTGKP